MKKLFANICIGLLFLIGFTKQTIQAQTQLYPEVYSSFFGGNKNDWGNALTTDSKGNVIVTLATFSTNLTLVNEVQAENRGSADIFIAKFKTDMKTILFSSYYGGSDWDGATGITSDSLGNVYIVGKTQSNDFPCTSDAFDATYNGGFDAFFIKMDSTGTIVYATFLGGNGDEHFNICLDDSLNVYISGVTNSTDMPIKNAMNNALKGGKDLYLAKFNNKDLSLVFSTYLGGTANENSGSVYCGSNIIVYGVTESEDLYTKNAYQSTISGASDIFLTVLNKTGNEILMSTYFGGNGEEGINSLIVDENNTCIFTGHTSSTDINCTEMAISNQLSGGTDIFLAELKLDELKLSYFSYIGGTANDWGGKIFMNNNHSFFLLGMTRSDNFPISLNAYQKTYKGHDDTDGSYFGDIILMKISTLTNTPLYSTYIGGSNNEGVHYDMIVSDTSKVYISAHSSSADFPVTNDAADMNFLGGYCDAVLLKFDFDKVVSSINNKTIIPEAKVYPIPFKNEIYIDLQSLPDNECSYDIFSLDGKNVKSGELSYFNAINLSDINEGMYFLNLSINNSIIIHKIFKW